MLKFLNYGFTPLFAPKMRLLELFLCNWRDKITCKSLTKQKFRQLSDL